MICPTHQTELVNRKGVSKKTGKPYDFWGCTQKDGDTFCPFTAPGAKAAAPTNELQSKALSQIQVQLNRMEENQKKLGQMIASIGGRLPVEEKKVDEKSLPF